MAFSIPLFSRDKSKSHCAIGRIYDIVVVSNIVANADGIAINAKSKLNFPKPVASIAVSKSLGF